MSNPLLAQIDTEKARYMSLHNTGRTDAIAMHVKQRLLNDINDMENKINAVQERKLQRKRAGRVAPSATKTTTRSAEKQARSQCARRCGFVHNAKEIVRRYGAVYYRYFNTILSVLAKTLLQAKEAVK